MLAVGAPYDPPIGEPFNLKEVQDFGLVHRQPFPEFFGEATCRRLEAQLP